MFLIIDKALAYFQESGDSLQIRAATYRKAVSCMNRRDYNQSVNPGRREHYDHCFMLRNPIRVCFEMVHENNYRNILIDLFVFVEGA